MQGSTPFADSTLTLTRTLARTFLRQIRFPSLSRCLVEAPLMCAVFLASGHVSLGFGLVEMLVPMVPVVFVMMISSVLSGVYRCEITTSIVKLHVHSAYGFALGTVAFLVTVSRFFPEYADGRFLFLFLLATFFVTNTVRPLISGTDFMDGGGRRGN